MTDHHGKWREGIQQTVATMYQRDKSLSQRSQYCLLKWRWMEILSLHCISINPFWNLSVLVQWSGRGHLKPGIEVQYLSIKGSADKNDKKNWTYMYLDHKISHKLSVQMAVNVEDVPLRN